MTLDAWFAEIAALQACHSPSGWEGEIDAHLQQRFQNLGHSAEQDEAGNLIVQIAGDRPEVIAVTAHKDEIGMIVEAIEADGKVRLNRLGGSYPWIYGEGPVDLLGDRAIVSGILSFGSRHIAHSSPQRALQNDKALHWSDSWIETKQTVEALQAAGIRPGTRVVVSRDRKRPQRLGQHIAGYALDNKASLAILLDLAAHLQRPTYTVHLVASAKEEVGAIGALFHSQRQRLAALIALEIIPLAPEYPITDSEAPVLLSQDAYGLYDEDLNRDLRQAAIAIDLPIQEAILQGFGSDGSIAMKFGHVPRAACLGFATQNTHGYEIADLAAIANCSRWLQHFLQPQPVG